MPPTIAQLPILSLLYINTAILLFSSRFKYPISINTLCSVPHWLLLLPKSSIRQCLHHKIITTHLTIRITNARVYRPVACLLGLPIVVVTQVASIHNILLRRFIHRCSKKKFPNRSPKVRQISIHQSELET